MNRMCFGKNVLRYLFLTLAMICSATASAETTLEKVKHRIEDSAMVVANVDLDEFDFDSFMSTISDLYGNPADLKEAQDGFRTDLKYLEDKGVDSITFTMSIRDINTGPCILISHKGSPTDARDVGKRLLSMAPNFLISPANELGMEINGDVVVFGNKETVARVMSAQTPKLSAVRTKQVATAWETAGSGVQIAFVPSDDTRTAIEQLAPPLPKPMEAFRIEDILDGAQWASFGMHMANGPNLKLTLQSKDESSAKKMEKLLTVATSMVSQQAPKEAQAAVRKLLAAEQNGDRLVTKISSEEFASAQKLLLNPMRENANQTILINNLKHIGLAMLNFESAYGAYPPHASYGKDGKPLLSWRVYVLPFMDSDDLYKEFHLDEPWNSEHNRKLIPRIPEVFKNRTGKVKKGSTTLLVPYGKDTMFFGKNGTKMRTILDGTSRTLLCVDVSPENAVPWTKPSDLEVNLKKPFDGLMGEKGSFAACRCDGSVQRWQKGDLTEDQLKALFTKAGGEVGDF